ncbi:MAG TPA: diguanylate cyclase [Acidimicrobiales bacterium]|nr:diguanylate cyclase [Acidimicrobiales bacterium]
MGVALSDALTSLTQQLASVDSGIEFVYAMLDRLVDVGGWQDAAVVIDEPTMDRQVFRASRRPPWDWPFAHLDKAGPGFYTVPDHGDDELDVVVGSLATVALQLDLLRHDATHDGLTGLLNRRSFDELLAQASSRSHRYGWPFALALIDLDNFKGVNDRLGHDGGDRVLRAVGTELRRSLRAGDVAARVGGDEFALILANGESEGVDAIVERLTRVLAGLLDSERAFSVGVAVAPDEADEVVELYRLADRRLYEGKRRMQ